MLYNVLIVLLSENSTKYKEIVHHWDVWHGGQNLGMKVIAVSNVDTTVICLKMANAFFSYSAL